MKSTPLFPNHFFARASVASLAVTTLIGLAMAADKPGSGLVLSPRTLPPPAHVSAELRKALADAPAPNVPATIAATPKTTDEWKQWIAEHDAKTAKAVEAATRKLGMTVSEESISGVRCYRLIPAKLAEEHKGRLFVHVHGGGFVKNSGLAAAGEGALIAASTGMEVLSIDYRMPPDHPFPAALDDVVAVWKAVAGPRAPGTTALGGTSGGANITLATMLKIKELGLPFPGALFVGTPGIDMAKYGGDSRTLNEGVDRNLVTWDALAVAGFRMYAGDADPKNPFISPVYGDVSGFPPTYLISGTRDLLLSDTVIMHRKLRRAGVAAELHVYEGMAHADYAFAANLPESQEHFRELNAFLSKTLAPGGSQAETEEAGAQPVRISNFVRAETDRYFANEVKEKGIGTLVHLREFAPIDKQGVVRMNRDTLYSSGVFDLDAAPVSIMLPDPGSRYMAMLVINQDHYVVDIFHAPGDFDLTKKTVGSRYVYLILRTLADANDADDMKAAHLLQDKVKIAQRRSGTFEVPDWDQRSLTAIRDALEVLGRYVDSGTGMMFGSADKVDPFLHLIGTAIGWGGNPRGEAVYDSVVPDKNDGKTPYTLSIADVPIEDGGFWSITVYDETGYMFQNDLDTYSLNSLTAKREKDGSVLVHFGGDRESSANYLPIKPGWSYTVRLYRPGKTVIDGSWTFPKAIPDDQLARNSG